MKFVTKVFLLIIYSFWLYATNLLANQILVTPSRLVFEDGTRSGRVIVSNPSDQSADYRVVLDNRKMTLDGKIELISEPETGQLFADRILRYSPKKFSLEPKTSRTIRIKVRNLAELPAGEYRSHLKMEVLPKAVLPDLNAQNVKIQIQVNYGISIPLIVRKGDLKFALEVTDYQFDNGDCSRPNLQIMLKRTGDRSSFGDVSVFFINQQGQQSLVKHLKGISVYTPNLQRQLNLDLNTEGRCLEAGQLKFIYSEHSASRDLPEIIAEDLIIDEKIIPL